MQPNLDIKLRLSDLWCRCPNPQCVNGMVQGAVNNHLMVLEKCEVCEGQGVILRKHPNVT